MLHISADIVPVHDRGVDEQFRSHRISPTGHPQGYIPRIRMNTTTPAVSWSSTFTLGLGVTCMYYTHPTAKPCYNPFGLRRQAQGV